MRNKAGGKGAQKARVVLAKLMHGCTCGLAAAVGKDGGGGSDGDSSGRVQHHRRSKVTKRVPATKRDLGSGTT